MSNNENRENLPDEKEIFNELVGICRRTCKGKKKIESLMKILETNVKGDRNMLCALKAELNASKENNNVEILLAIVTIMVSFSTMVITVTSGSFGEWIMGTIYKWIVLAAAALVIGYGLFLCCNLMKSKKNSYIEAALSEYESSLDKTIN